MARKRKSKLSTITRRAKLMRLKRLHETEEQAQERRHKCRLYSAKRIATETPERRKERLSYLRHKSSRDKNLKVLREKKEDRIAREEASTVNEAQVSEKNGKNAGKAKSKSKKSVEPSMLPESSQEVLQPIEECPFNFLKVIIDEKPASEEGAA